MPTYETFKYCGHVTPAGEKCEATAVAECRCSETHVGDDDGWAVKADKYANHPRFVCVVHRAVHED